MDRTAKDLSLRAHGLLSSLQTQMQIAFRASLNLYSPETWLVLYYPLFYFAKVVKRDPQWAAKQGKGILFDSSFSTGDPQASPYVTISIIVKTALPLVILGPLCYLFLVNYHLLDSRSWRATSPAEEPSESDEEPIYDTTSRAPERLLQTEIDIGLTEEQVSERQKKYGPNEIVTTRNWFYVSLQLAFGATNLVLDSSSTKSCVKWHESKLGGDGGP